MHGEVLRLKRLGGSARLAGGFLPGGAFLAQQERIVGWIMPEIRYGLIVERDARTEEAGERQNSQPKETYADH